MSIWELSPNGNRLLIYPSVCLEVEGSTLADVTDPKCSLTADPIDSRIVEELHCRGIQRPLVILFMAASAVQFEISMEDTPLHCFLDSMGIHCAGINAPQ